MVTAAYTSRQPTASQWASATVHLERRDEWLYYWREGVRYVRIISGRSNRLYVARADADGCSCAWSQNPWSGGTPCSHRIALELDALEEELRDVLAEQGRAAGFAGQGEVESVKPIEELWATCKASGCDEDPEPREQFCFRHVLVDAF